MPIPGLISATVLSVLAGPAVAAVRSVALWLRHGWQLALDYGIGFFVMLAVLGWNPDPPHKKAAELRLVPPVAIAAA